MSNGSHSQIIYGESRNDAPIHALGTNDLTERIGATLRGSLIYREQGVKGIARAANINESAAENLCAGRCLPNFKHAMALLATVPEFSAEVRYLTKLETEMDPLFEREMTTAMNAFSRWRARRDGDSSA